MSRLCSKTLLTRILMALIILFMATIHSGKASGLAPVITEHPEDITVVKNEPVTLRCEAIGDPEPEISWFKNGEPVVTAAIDHKSHRVLLPSGALFFLRAVQTRREDDAGAYYCKAYNQHGVAKSKNATLVIAVLKDKFRSEPDDVGVLEGGLARFECSPPKGSPLPTVFWKKNGRILDFEKDDRLSMVNEGTLVITKVSERDQGNYQCFAKNIAGTRSSNEADLTILVKPEIVKAPENVSVVVGQSFRLVCVVSGRPQPEVRWSRRSATIPADRIGSTTNSAELVVFNAQPEDADEYICIAENRAGQVRNSAWVNVNSPPILVVTPPNRKVSEGDSVELSCVAAGNPTPTLFWMKEGGTGILLAGSREGHVQVSPEGSLRIDSVKLNRDEGFYSCVAISSSGSEIARAELKISSPKDEGPRSPPVIQLGPTNQTLQKGSSTHMPCEPIINDVWPSESLIVNWLKDGVPVESTMMSRRISISNDNTLHVKELSIEDSGIYTCQVRSSRGQAVMSSSLTVFDPSLNPDDLVQKVVPELSEFPGSPSRPFMINATANSITLSWEKPLRIGGSPLQGYQVEYYRLSTPTHWVTVPEVQDVTVVIQDLSPGSSIVALVRARNAHGLSPPSPLSKEFKTLPKKDNAGQLTADGIRDRLAERLVVLRNVYVVGPRKIKLVWDLLSSNELIDGYHIQIRGETHGYIENNVYNDGFDVITIAGGATRSHTLSDLRPNTKYSIFILPFHKRIKGKPSNMRIVTTKEDAPDGIPQDLKAHLFNLSSAVISWNSPDPRELHGDLMGFKIFVVNQNSSDVTNYTLPPALRELTLHDLISDHIYEIKVAAYNRQGMGPFTDPLEIAVNPEEILIHNQMDLNPSVVQRSNKNGFKNTGELLIIQELWFVALVSFLSVVFIVVFVAAICIKRKALDAKGIIGHYNVPVRKIDDISHLNFSGDRDHLWFDPSWGQQGQKKASSSSSGSCKEAKESSIPRSIKDDASDPMAVMLDNHARNKHLGNNSNGNSTATSAHIFINNLMNDSAPEYAEVDGVNVSVYGNGSGSQGPYATTNLVDTPSYSLKTPPPSTASSRSKPGADGSAASMASPANSGGSGNVIKDPNSTCRSSDSSSSRQSKRSCKDSPLPPLPPPPSSEALKQKPLNQQPPPPPARNSSSFLGTRNGLSANPSATGSHYSVPGFFYQATPTPPLMHPHPASCCASPAHHARFMMMMGGSGANMAASSGFGGSDSLMTDEHYESASICFGQPRYLNNSSYAVYAPRNGWDWKSFVSEEAENCGIISGDDGESCYAGSEFGLDMNYLGPRLAPAGDAKAELLSLPSGTPQMRRRPGHAHLPPHQQIRPRPPRYGYYKSRPISSCSTESNYGSTNVMIRPMNRRGMMPVKGQQDANEPIYSTFKPVETANAATTTDEECFQDPPLTEDEANIGKTECIDGNALDNRAKNHQDDAKVHFAQVSEDMNELVFHLNTIESNISELAGRPISICESKD